MKKYIILILLLFFISGCSDLIKDINTVQSQIDKIDYDIMLPIIYELTSLDEETNIQGLKKIDRLFGTKFEHHFKAAKLLLDVIKQFYHTTRDVQINSLTQQAINRYYEVLEENE